MPLLIKDKCFAQQRLRLNIAVPEVLPENWVTALYGLAADQMRLDDQLFDDTGHTPRSAYIREAEKHTGIFSTYNEKEALLNSLKIVYAAYISNTLTANQKLMIAYQLQEGASNCTPGFHTRVDFINLQLKLNAPEHFDHLLCNTRINIIDQVARVLLQNDTQSVHGTNRLFLIARGLGYGVQPLYEKDSYINSGGVSHAAMTQALKKGFSYHYNLFGILTSLRDQLDGLLRIKGYDGAKEAGYSIEESEKFSQLINPFIAINREVLFKKRIEEVEMDGEKIQRTIIVDIDWHDVTHALLTKLCNGYLTLSKEEEGFLARLPTIGEQPTLNTLISNGYELAYCLTFFNGWTIAQKVAFANSYLKDKSKQEQEAVLSILESQAPPLTKELKSQPEFCTRYFKIAIQKRKAADVRAYIEQGADINKALSLLFSEEHKSQTLYWLYERKDLLAKITPAGAQAIIPDGKYQGKTIATALRGTKKGRQVLLANGALRDLFSEAQMQRAQEETPSVVINGLFKQPDPLATKLGQYIVYGDLANAEKILQENPQLRQKLLTEKVTVTDYSGCKKKHKTALQLAFCAWDEKLNVSENEAKNDPDAMAEMLAKYMVKEDIDRQYKEIFPEGHEKFFAEQKPFDFSEIIRVISQSSEAKVEKALALEQPNETTLWKALEEFRKAFTKLSKKEMVWNPQHLCKAFEEYDANFNTFGGSYDSPKNMLFWRQVVGYTQRFLPANIAMDFAQSIDERVEQKKKPLRSFNFKYGKGGIYPLPRSTLAGLGFEFSVVESFGVGSRHGTVAGLGSGRGLQNLCQAKAATLENLCKLDRVRGLRAGV